LLSRKCRNKKKREESISHIRNIKLYK